MYRAILVGVVACLTSVPAWAQEGSNGTLPSTIVQIAQAQPPGLTMSEFRKFDTNKDGLLSQEELEAGRDGVFAAADTSGDGVLTQEEFVENKLAKPREIHSKRFIVRDANGDGSLTPDENKGNIPLIFERLDTNGDGFISREELLKRPNTVL